MLQYLCKIFKETGLAISQVGSLAVGLLDIGSRFPTFAIVHALPDAIVAASLRYETNAIQIKTDPTRHIGGFSAATWPATKGLSKTNGKCIGRQSGQRRPTPDKHYVMIGAVHAAALPADFLRCQGCVPSLPS